MKLRHKKTTRRWF